MYLIDVCLMGVCLMGIHLTGVVLTGASVGTTINKYLSFRWGRRGAVLWLIERYGRDGTISIRAGAAVR
jgi:hypothetical protein